MANPNRTAYAGPPLSGQGILWISSKIIAPDQISPELYNNWYENIHIPDIIGAKPGGVIASSRYQSMDSSRPTTYLAIYTVPDLGFLQSPEFKGIRMGHEMLPGGGPIHRFAAFDSRFYRRVQLEERPGAPAGRAPILISAAIQPADGMEKEFDDWYREEHLQQLQDEAPEWRRSARYELVFKIENKDDSPEKRAQVPNYLTLHEFEDGPQSSGEKLVSPVKQTEWTKKIMGNAKSVDAAKFRRIATIGDENASF